MKQIIKSNRFKQDFKLMLRRGADPQKLEAIITYLIAAEPLPARCRPHKLSGAYFGFWECHIQPDWLLIYAVGVEFIELAATGTHADLFK
jgi:mRNA interferase YafQ